MYLSEVHTTGSSTSSRHWRHCFPTRITVKSGLSGINDAHKVRARGRISIVLDSLVGILDNNWVERAVQCQLRLATGVRELTYEMTMRSKLLKDYKVNLSPA